MDLHDQSKLNDNDFLCSLNMENATREETLAWLSKIIENETNKPEAEQDQDLMVECLDYIDELLASEIVCSEEDLQKELTKIKETANKKATVLLMKPKRKRKLLRSLIAAAATFCILFSCVAIAAASQGYPSIGNFIKQNIAKVLQMKPGDSFTDGNITLIKNGETYTYASLEELLKTEKYDCMLFDYLPKGIKLDRITEEKIDDTKFSLIFRFNNSNISIAIMNYQNVSEESLQKYPLHQSPNIDFYIQKIEDFNYIATGYKNGYEYQIIYTDYEELTKILDSMKGTIS